MLKMNAYQNVIRKTQNISPNLNFFDAMDRRLLSQIALKVSESCLPVSAEDQGVAGRASGPWSLLCVA